MFENLTNKFEEVFSSLKKAPSLDENQVDEGLRGIRQALLEADVSLEVANVTKKIDPNAPHNVLLVLDATSGQNVLNQVEEFNKIIPITGIVMTKLDGTAKGGILLALAKKYEIPIIALGLGEKEDDLQLFKAEKFAEAFTLYTVTQKKLGASLTGFTLYVFTVYGAIYGYFLFDEKFENYHFIGTILVFFGIYLAKKNNVKKV